MTHFPLLRAVIPRPPTIRSACFDLGSLAKIVLIRFQRKHTRHTNLQEVKLCQAICFPHVKRPSTMPSNACGRGGALESRSPPQMSPRQLTPLTTPPPPLFS